MLFFSLQLFKENKPDGFDSTQFITEQVFYPSKDGTHIPMFLSYKKVGYQFTIYLAQNFLSWFSEKYSILHWPGNILELSVVHSWHHNSELTQPIYFSFLLNRISVMTFIE